MVATTIAGDQTVEQIMRVADMCTRRVIQATPSMTVIEAARLMARHQVGALVVVATAESNRPVGMLTDRDIAVDAVTRDTDLSSLQVGAIMAPAVVTCEEDDDPFDVIQMMRSRGVRRMPVVDGNGILIGMLSVDDMIGELTEHLLTLARTLTYAAAHESMVHDGNKG